MTCETKLHDAFEEEREQKQRVAGQRDKAWGALEEIQGILKQTGVLSLYRDLRILFEEEKWKDSE